MRTIIFYRTLTGKCPVEQFLDNLSSKQAQKVTWVLKLVEDLDFVPGNYLKNLVNTNGILEIRIQFGKDIFRLLGFQKGRNIVILTNGFQKKTQKTPFQEIKLAEKRKREYLDRGKKK
ncbi:MAG: type II toxin-antitoxin system RelE/ParE family toxin [Candidatus Aureabacteria bacterium]|nr:type II toxin-antitoxin system RelE/ParE family toxin [Candidatus Auribacterota bacterium]